MSDRYVDPDRETFRGLKELPLGHPVEMLNLVRLHARARYDDGREVSGADAYRAYGEASRPIFEKVGGRVVWSATPEFMLIGPSDELWDIAFVARYPTGQAFLDMVHDPDYQAIVHHRQAAVETSRLIRTKPRDPGASFG